MSMTKRRLFLLSCTASLVLAACGGGSDDDFDDRTNAAEPRLRLVHVAPASLELTLRRNDVAEPEFTSKGYKFNGAYKDISTDSSTSTTSLSLRLAATDTALSSATFSSQRGRKYTALALTDGVSAKLLLIDDPYNKSLTSEKARVRLVNNAVNATNVDIYITAPGASLTTLTPTLTGLAYQQALPASGNDSLEFDAGTYEVQITPVGSKTPFFRNTLVVDKNADWLLVAVPSDGIGLSTPNDIKLLRALTDDPTLLATEVSTL